MVMKVLQIFQIFFINSHFLRAKCSGGHAGLVEYWDLHKNVHFFALFNVVMREDLDVEPN